MYWPSSGKTAGYEKGKYSHALPAGVAFIGLFSFSVGLIISVGFPNIVLDWTKSSVCIMGPWQREYPSWVNDLNRLVTVTIRFWNLTNSAEFLYNKSAPIFTLSEPIGINYSNTKYDVEFYDGRVKYKRSFTRANYTNNETKCRLSCSKNGSEAIIAFNSKDYQKFSNQSELFNYFQHFGSFLNQSLEYWHMEKNVDKFKSWLSSTFNGACQDSMSDQNRSVEWNAKLCQIFQKPFEILISTRRVSVTNLALSIMDTIFDFNGAKFVYDDRRACSALCDNSSSKLQYLIQYHICKTYDMYQVLDRCVKTNRTLWQFGDTIIDQKQTLDVLEHLIFTTLKIFLRFRLNDNEFAFKRSSSTWLTHASASELTKIIFNEKLSSSLKMCIDKWNLDASTIFRWSEFNGYTFEMNTFSEYALPPVKKINPCLPPSPKKFYTVMFDGIWSPLQFRYKGSMKLNSENVHRYEAANDAFTAGTSNIDLNQIYGLPLFVTLPCGHLQEEPKRNNCIDFFRISTKFDFSVEPITGSIWNYEINYQLNAKLPDELFILYNISSDWKNRLLPLMHIRRTVDLTLIGETFFKASVKPFLMVICGGTVVFHCLAIGLLMLAAYLVIRLHWKPIKGRRFVAQLPDLDFQQLNTVKLRKLLGQ